MPGFYFSSSQGLLNLPSHFTIGWQTFESQVVKYLDVVVQQAKVVAPMQIYLLNRYHKIFSCNLKNVIIEDKCLEYLGEDEIIFGGGDGQYLVHLQFKTQCSLPKSNANDHLLMLVFNEILCASSLKIEFHTDRYCQILI